MSLINKVKSTEKVIEVEYPDIKGFKIKLNYLGRDSIARIRDESSETKYNTKTRRTEETTNDEKFLEGYSKAIIKGWSGLKMKDLSKLIPVDLSMIDNPNEDVPFSDEEALELIRESTVFDQFISSVISDVERFNEEKKETTIKNSKGS